MTDKQGPTLRAQWLGQQLKDLRDQAGFTLKQVAEFLERDPSTVSRFESAEYPVRRADLMALLDFYALSDKRRREALLTLREDVWRKGWWDGYADDVDRRFIDYVWLESRAREIHTFDNTLLLGLLQTPDYARAAIVAADFTAGSEQVERWVDLRMTRQGILSGTDPPRLHSIIDECVLRRVVGGTEVARAQLRHLAKSAERPNVNIQVLPFRAGAHACPAGAFRILTLTDPYPNVGYAETLAGAVYVEAPETDRFVQVYHRLHGAAMDSNESVKFISALAKELR
jgi:transcriptional regulator with XRE-family HTH domain